MTIAFRSALCPWETASRSAAGGDLQPSGKHAEAAICTARLAFSQLDAGAAWCGSSSNAFAADAESQHRVACLAMASRVTTLRAHCLRMQVTASMREDAPYGGQSVREQSMRHSQRMPSPSVGLFPLLTPARNCDSSSPRTLC